MSWPSASIRYSQVDKGAPRSTSSTRQNIPQQTVVGIQLSAARGVASPMQFPNREYLREANIRGTVVIEYSSKAFCIRYYNSSIVEQDETQIFLKGQTLGNGQEQLDFSCHQLTISRAYHPGRYQRSDYNPLLSEPLARVRRPRPNASQRYDHGRGWPKGSKHPVSSQDNDKNRLSKVQGCRQSAIGWSVNYHICNRI